MSWKSILLTATAAFLSLAAFSALALAQQTPPATSRWPAEFNTTEGQVTIFQPQLENFQGDQLTARAAVSVQLNGQTDPVFGVIWLLNHVSVDEAARTVRVLDTSVLKSRFPSDDPNINQAVADATSQLFASRSVVFSLDHLENVVDTLHKEQAASDQLQTAPPTIQFLDHAAIKVQYDGDPRLVAVDNSNLLRAVNTPFFVVLEPTSKMYYLKGGGRWFSAPDPLGPFSATYSVPADVSALADASGYQDPQQPVDPTQPIDIVTATEPTELIWFRGPRQMGTIHGTNLLYVANTDSDVFMDIDNQQYYVLLSGRWYSSPGLSGPWSFVAPESLPADFRQIPSDSPKADVLVSIPGTDVAQAAVEDAYVPQTAAIDTQQFDQPPISYDGDPDFQPVEGTDMSYAVNTGSSVLLVGQQYYACYNAVWYQADAPIGPWNICLSVPTEVYEIPPSCPIYPVRFVYIYGRHDNAVYFGYLPGYLGGYVYHGVVIYGTGYHYRPWEGSLYYSRPYTFGFASHYDFYTRHWGFNFAVGLGDGFDWVGIDIGGGGDRFHHDSWFGHGGYRPVYAPDIAHIDSGRRAFAAAGAGRDSGTINVYNRRNDVHRDLPSGGPGPREISRPAAENRGNNYNDRSQARPEQQFYSPREQNSQSERFDGSGQPVRINSGSQEQPRDHGVPESPRTSGNGSSGERQSGQPRASEAPPAQQRSAAPAEQSPPRERHDEQPTAPRDQPQAPREQPQAPREQEPRHDQPQAPREQPQQPQQPQRPQHPQKPGEQPPQ